MKGQKHFDGRPIPREFDYDMKLFWRSLNDWLKAEGICIYCRKRKARQNLFSCGECR